MKYNVSATITVTVEDVIVDIDQPLNAEDELQDAIIQKLQTQMTILDIRGSRSGDDGYIASIECEAIDSWGSV